jgi:integrase
MKATEQRQPQTTAENVIPLAIQPTPPKPAPQHRQRFKIQPFANPRTGTQSWRVTGMKRDGTRVRENFVEQQAAECRQVELTTEWLARQTDTAIRATKLTDTQLRLAESAFARLDADHEISLAVEHWLKHGKALSVAESPRLDDAFAQFAGKFDESVSAWVGGWLDAECKLRDLSKKNLRRRVNVFVNSVPNMRVVDITPETVEGFLSKRDISATSKDNDRRALSAFLSWCMDRKRRWISVNPCNAVRIERGEKAPPSILSVEQCRKILRKAAKHKGGRMALYVSVCLFGGLRPFEVRRLTWQAVNLADGEIRLEGNQTKTGRPRVVAICDTLREWLKAYKDKPFFPSNWRRDFDVVKASIGYGTATEKSPKLTPWVDDIFRHTAISHFFRKTGSYGQTAEQFGNSEAIIKAHYQGRVSTDDTKKFYALRPAKGGRK